MKPPFYAPAAFIPIDRDELQTVKPLTPTVEIVQYKGKYKFMNYLSQTVSFEMEITHHLRVLGSRFVPRLYNIVQHKGENRGLLLEFIDGKDLSELCSSLDSHQRYSITAATLDAIADFETHGYYPQDLKCANIVLRHSDMVFVVDLSGGFSQGMYLPDDIRASGRGSILS